MKWFAKLLARIKENFIKHKVLFIVFIVIWVLLVIGTLSFYKTTFGKEPIGGDTYKYTYELTKDSTYTEIIPIEKNTQAISIKYATYIRNNKGHIYVKIKGIDTDDVYLDTKTNVRFIQDNAYVTYKLNEEIDSSKESSVEITLTSDSEKETCAGVYYSYTNFFKDSKLSINNKDKVGELAVEYLITNNVYSAFSNGIVTFTIILLSLVILIMLVFDPKEEILITTMVLSFGLIFTFIMSPGAIPDENDHYEHSLQISNIMMFKQNNIIDKEYVNYDSFGSFVNASHSYNRFMRDIDKALELSGKNHELAPRENYIYKHYYIVYYIPQAIGVTIARLFNMNTLKTYYAGRISNLIFYAICVFIAIKNTPIHKLLFGIISMLPIFIQQAASFSYDGFINGLSLISIAFFLKWYFSDKQISIKDIIIVFIASLALAPAKIVYAFFAVLFVLVPTTRFGSKKKKILILLLIMAPSIFVILDNIWARLSVFFESYLETITVYAKNIKFSDGDTGFEINGGYTYSISYVLSHPIKTLTIIFTTVRFWLSTWFYQSLGKALAGVTLILPMTFIRIILILIGASTLTKQKYQINNTIRISFIIICLVVSMFIILGMLFGWTLTTDTMIQGIQGRYFCPLLPYFFSIFNNKKIVLPQKLDKYVLFTYILLMFEVVTYVLSYTFVN